MTCVRPARGSTSAAGCVMSRVSSTISLFKLMVVLADAMSSGFRLSLTVHTARQGGR